MQWSEPVRLRGTFGSLLPAWALLSTGLATAWMAHWHAIDTTKDPTLAFISIIQSMALLPC